MRIEFKNRTTKALEETEGTDGRLDVSSRSDSRAYYNSRDDAQCYTMVWDFQSAASGEFGAYLKNTHTTKQLVIRSIGINAAADSRVKAHFVTGTATGTAVTPVNLNRTSNNDALATAVEGAAAATGITGLTSDGVIDFAYVAAGTHEEMRIGDTVRLGQGDAIALEVDETAGSDFSGVIFFFFE